MSYLLEEYLEKKRALLAFNLQNIYQIQSLYALSLKKKLPVFAQFSAKYVPYLDKLYGLRSLVDKFQNNYLLFHLDHCADESLIRHCIDCGFASVMFDGSALPLEENIRLTNKIYLYARYNNCLLEAELGAIRGVEDDFGADDTVGYFSRDELVVFNESAKFDMLALAIGNAHGIYISTKSIKIEMLAEARKLVGKRPFVLHGGTGMPDALIEEAITYGVVKINVSTALKMEHFRILKLYIEQNHSYDEMKFADFFSRSVTPFFDSLMTKYTSSNEPGN